MCLSGVVREHSAIFLYLCLYFTNQTFMANNDNELFIPWTPAPEKATAENPYREGPALTKHGRLLGRAPEIDTDDESLKRTVLDYYDLQKMVPFFKDKPKLVHWLMRIMKLDNVNYLHHRNLNTPGAPFVRGLLDDFHISMRVDGADVLNNLPEGPFITVSNHPFGALDGIMLIDLLASRRSDYKVMVNLILNHIRGMRPNFIAVDPLSSNDPEKRAITMKGIKEAMMHVRRGHPLGFFPAGAMSKLNSHLRIEDREWQPSIIRLIQQLNVPIVPVYFHGHNSTIFNLLGVISWQLRTLRLPAEVFAHCGTTYHISVGDVITPDEQKQYADTQSFGAMLRQHTYALRSRK